MNNIPIKFRAFNKRDMEMIYPCTKYCSYEESLGIMIRFQKELMQYTGQKDFNGKEIYVSDILSNKFRCVVYQSKCGAYMVYFGLNQNINKPITLLEYLKQRKIAKTDNLDNIIIGNTWENPELIK